MKRHGGTIAVVALLAVALRWLGLGDESLWFDEGMTWWLASLSPAELIRVIRGDVAAPLHYLLLHGWRSAFGDTDVAMRAFSALAATLTLVPFFLLARRAIASPTVLLIACGLMAVSFMQVQYAREARYYALLGLVSVTALACVPVLAQRRSWGAMAGLVVASSAGMYTHNIMMFYLPGLLAAWLIWPGERPTRARLVDMSLAGGVLVLLYLPWVPILLQQLRWMTGSFWADRPGVLAGGAVTSAISGIDIHYAPGTAWAVSGWVVPRGLIAASGAVCLAGAIGLLYRSRVVLALAAFAIGPVIVVFFYSQLRQPIFLERLFIASSAVTPILLAMPLDRGRRLAVRGAGVGIVLVVSLLTLLSTARLLVDERKEDWRGAYQAVAQLPPSDRRLIVFVANEGEMPFWYYAAHDDRPAEPRTGAPQGFLDLDPPVTIRRVLADGDLQKLRQQLSSGRWDEVVLVLSHTDFSDPQNRTETELRTRWRLVDEKELRLVRVLRFVPPLPSGERVGVRGEASHERRRSTAG